MPSVVLCSELGRGFGHLAKLADYAVELEAQGYSVKLVTHDLHAAHQIPEFFDMAIFQSPTFWDRHVEYGLTDSNQLNYASLLRMNGFRDVATLAPVLRGWLHILATLNADLVIADSAPSAVFAAKLLNIPRIMTGSGYAVPPLTEPLRTICPWEEPAEDRLRREDELLVHVLNDTVSELGFSDVRFSRGKDLFDEAAQWIFSIPEMDHYGPRDQPYVVRWTNSAPRLSPEWPRVRGDRILVHMEADSYYLSRVLEALQLLNQPVIAIVPGVSNGLMELYHNTNIRLQREPVDLKQAVNDCNIFINDASHDLVYELLTYGVPSILLPNKPEQVMLAYRLVMQGFAFVGPQSVDELEIETLIARSRNQDQVWLNCSHLQIKYENHKSLHRLHDLIKTELLA